MDPNLVALQTQVTQAVALLDALFAQWQTDQATIASLQQQLAAVSGGTDSAALPALTTTLQAAVTRDTPPAPTPAPTPTPAAPGTAPAAPAAGSGVSPLTPAQPTVDTAAHLQSVAAAIAGQAAPASPSSAQPHQPFES